MRGAPDARWIHRLAPCLLALASLALPRAVQALDNVGALGPIVMVARGWASTRTNSWWLARWCAL